MTERRLAAILAADIVGYSALMAEDETATLEALRRLRHELFHPAVAGHRGKVVKAMGDGWLVEFASAVDAVSCAVRVQDGLERDPRIRLRTGIHIGDITHEDEDIFGDGVNVAARLEAISEPGSIVISDAVYGALDGTLTPSFDDAGERHLKNIPRPVRIWTRGAAIAADRSAVAISGRSFKVAATVVPVAASDSREEVRELAAALTSDISDLLGNSAWLVVTAAETPPAGSYVLTPVLRARGDRLRLEATLAAPGGAKLWSHRLDGDLGQSFDWQDEAASDFAAGAFAVILDAERRRVAVIAEAARDAETCLLAAHLEMAAVDEYDLPEVIGLIEASLERRPGYVDAYALGAGYVHMIALSLGASLPYARFAGTFREWVRQAENLLDPADPARIPVALALHATLPDPNRLHHQIRVAARKYPFSSDVLGMGSLGLVHLGEPRAALDFAERNYRLLRDTPQAFGPLIIKARANIMLGDDEAGLGFARDAMRRKAGFPACHALAASALAHLGRMDEARAEVDTIRRLAPGMTVTSIRRDNGYVDNAATRRYFDGLRLAGLPEGEA